MVETGAGEASLAGAGLGGKGISCVAECRDGEAAGGTGGKLPPEDDGSEAGIGAGVGDEAVSG